MKIILILQTKIPSSASVGTVDHAEHSASDHEEAPDSTGHRKMQKPRKRPAVHTKQNDELLDTFFGHTAQKKTHTPTCTTDSRQLNEQTDMDIQKESDRVSIDWMKAQHKLTSRKRNNIGIALRMIKTFNVRQDMIKKGVDVAKIKTRFPLFFKNDEIIAEFKRITDIDLVRKFEDGLNNYCSKLLTLGAKATEKYTTKVPQLVTNLKTEIATSPTLVRQNYAHNCLALLSLPYLLGEKLRVIVKTTPSPSTATPYLLFHMDKRGIINLSKIEVYADAVHVCETDNIVNGFCLLLAIFYVFNIAFPINCISTLTFLQKYICNLPGEVDMDPRALCMIMAKLSKC